MEETVTARRVSRGRAPAKIYVRRFAARTIFVLILVSASLVFVSTATAATFGADLTLTPTNSTANLSLTQVMDPGGAATAGSPIAGVLTSVRIRTTGAAGAGEIRVLRLNAHPDPATYTFLNVASVSVAVASDVAPSGHITSTSTRLPILAGDRLSWSVNDSGGVIKESYTDVSAECAFTGTSHSVGVSLDYSTGSCNNNVLLVSGTVEADADHDGFGDETQDLCTTDATTQGPCRVVPIPADVTAPIQAPEAKSKQRVGKLLVTDQANEACTLRVTGKVKSGGKTYKFKSVSRTLAANTRTAVRLALSSKALNAVQRALKRHRLTAKITLVVKDVAGNSSTSLLSVRLRA